MHSKMRIFSTVLYRFNNPLRGAHSIIRLLESRSSITEKRMSSTTASPNEVSSIFDDVVMSRRFSKNFDKERSIDPDLIEKLLKLSQTAPSSFNLQPYKIIVVQRESEKEALADTMLGGNPQRVRDAPLTLVYLSDREPARLTQKLVELETAAGTDPGYLRDLRAKINALLGNGGLLAGKVRLLATHLASALQPSPIIPYDPSAWSVKNTIFAAQTFLLAATAHGLATAPMEGYDERRLCDVLGIPRNRYSIPLVICVGYSLENIEEKEKLSSGGKSRKRYPLEDICYTDRFDNNWKSSVVNRTKK